VRGRESDTHRSLENWLPSVPVIVNPSIYPSVGFEYLRIGLKLAEDRCVHGSNFSWEKSNYSTRCSDLDRIAIEFVQRVVD
jgi:hypothetical protein